jgi:hypothetical protein
MIYHFNNVPIDSYLSHGYSQFIGSRKDLHFFVIDMLAFTVIQHSMCNRFILLYAIFSTKRYYACINYFIQHNVHKYEFKYAILFSCISSIAHFELF